MKVVKMLMPMSIVLLSIFSVVMSRAIPEADDAAKMGTNLISTTFDSTVQKGMWLIEYFSPYCPHCQHFAPVWKMLFEMHGQLADTSDFHLGRVDCIAQGDLCQSKEVKGYPSIWLYRDGTKVDEYKGDRTYELLSTFILTNAKDYQRQLSSSS